MFFKLFLSYSIVFIPSLHIHSNPSPSHPCTIPCPVHIDLSPLPILSPFYGITLVSPKYRFDSERASMSGAIGDQMLELQHNNLALSNLGLVLHHLSSCQTDGLGQSKVRVPYRNNKLTHFLKVGSDIHHLTHELNGCPGRYVSSTTH